MDPWKKEDGMATEISVTLKMQGKDMPWIVVRGSDLDDVREATAKIAGVEAGSLTLSDIAHNANRRIQAVSTVGTVLEASVVEGEGGTAPPAEAPPAGESGLLGEVGKAETKAALVTLYTENAAAFAADQKLMDAMQAKSASFAQPKEA